MVTRLPARQATPLKNSWKTERRPRSSCWPRWTFWWTENSFWHSAIWTCGFAAAKTSASWTYPRALPRAEPYGVRRRAGWENGRHKRALRPRGTTETLAAPISCGRGSACRKRAILCAKCAKLPFCAPERSAEGNRKASAQHKASGVSQRLTALPAASAALRVKILFAIIGTFITRPVKE